MQHPKSVLSFTPLALIHGLSVCRGCLPVTGPTETETLLGYSIGPRGGQPSRGIDAS